MIIKECAFCETPVSETDNCGFCKVCARAFKVLTAEEIKQIQNKVGFKKQTPDKDFCRAS